jgi:transcriptional regulator with XRE-family HTH domain
VSAAPAIAPGTHPVDIAVRKNLRLLRKSRGWSLVQASRHLQIAPVTLATYERHEPMTTVRSLRVEVVAALAAAYGVPVGELYDEHAILMRTKGLRPSLAMDAVREVLAVLDPSSPAAAAL